MAFTIEKITAVAEQKMVKDTYKSYGTDTEMHLRMIDLGISSVRGAILLNRLIEWKYNTRPRSVRGYGSKGGGVLCKADCHIGITEVGEVKLVVRNVSDLVENIRIAKSEAEYIITIKDKIANELKKMCSNLTPTTADGPGRTISAGGKTVLGQPSGDWNGYENRHAVNLLTGETIEKIDYRVHEREDYSPISFTYEEYRCLYEFLKGRPVKKSIEKYGKKVYNQIIGSKIEDQFLLSAVEVLKGQITEAENGRNAEVQAENDRRNKEYAEMQKKHEDNLQQIKDFYDAKINELTKQINELVATAKQMANDIAAD